jgi:hypothetical protein
MLALFALALVVPFLRHFYELASPNGETIAAWAAGTAIGVGGMLLALRLAGRWTPPEEPAAQSSRGGSSKDI